MDMVRFLQSRVSMLEKVLSAVLAVVIPCEVGVTKFKEGDFIELLTKALVTGTRKANALAIKEEHGWHPPLSLNHMVSVEYSDAKHDLVILIDRFIERIEGVFGSEEYQEEGMHWDTFNEDDIAVLCADMGAIRHFIAEVCLIEVINPSKESEE